MYVCWALKGGAGTSVVSAALALVLAADRPTVLVDLVGDLPAVLGRNDGDEPGLAEWLAAGVDADGEALRRVEQPVADGCVLLPRGAAPLMAGDRAEALADLLAGRSRTPVIDAGIGHRDDPLLAALCDRAEHRLLVTRPCYLALRRVQASELPATGVVLVSEPGRALGRADVEAVAGVPVVAEIGWDPAVASAVDAGLLSSRLPRGLQRGLKGLVS